MHNIHSQLSSLRPAVWRSYCAPLTHFSNNLGMDGHRWAQVITHVPCGGNSLYPAGRLLITSTLDEIDGFGDFLRFAGPTAVWNSCKMLLFNFKTVSFLGFMEFDIADIGDLEDYGMLEDLVLHEMGHVIGFGCVAIIIHIVYSIFISFS